MVLIVFHTACALVAPAMVTCAIQPRTTSTASMALAVLWSILVYYPIAYFVCRHLAHPYGLVVVTQVVGAWSALVAFRFMDGRDRDSAAAEARGASPTARAVLLGASGLALALESGPLGRLSTHALESLVLTAVGAGVGWVVSNKSWTRAAPSTLWGHASKLVALAAVATAGSCFAPQAPVTVGFVLSSVYHGMPSGSAAATMAGLLAMVEATASGDVVPSTVLAIAALAGAVCYAAVQLRHRITSLRRFDPFRLYAVAGPTVVLLLLLIGCVVRGDRVGEAVLGPHPSVIARYIAAGIAAAGYSGVATYGLLRLVDATLGLRPASGGDGRPAKASSPATAA
jgi:Amt family ammonium transporter